MKKTIAWLKDHPLGLFFGLTLLLGFGLLFPLVYVESRADPPPLISLLAFYSGRLGTYTPVLVGILVTAWTVPGRSPASARKRRLVFGVVWLAALVVAVLSLQRSVDVDIDLAGLLILSAPVALLPAYVVSSAFSRITSLREYLSTLVYPRGKLIWYLVAVLTFPMLQIMGLAITNLVNGDQLTTGLRLDREILIDTLITFAFVFFYSGGINEEGGWRGFAQRRLQSRYSPLIAMLLLWIFLVLFHIPNDLIQYRDGGYLLVRIGLGPFITILFGWVYNRSQGSILAPALFHASMNSINTLQDAVPGTDAMSIMLVLFALFALVLDRMWKKLPQDHQAVYLPADHGLPTTDG